MLKTIIFVALCVLSTPAIYASSIKEGSHEKVKPPAKSKPEWVSIHHGRKHHERKENYYSAQVPPGQNPKIHAKDKYPDICPSDGCPPK